jgi:uncharacterized Zn-binding protein involved in type VI secretion
MRSPVPSATGVWRTGFALVACLSATGASAQAPPNCALKGSSSVMIGGRPALRLSDVANCPAALYQIIPSVRIEGQPMVYVKPVDDGETVCAASGDPTVSVEGKPAARLGDVTCRQNQPSD